MNMYKNLGKPTDKVYTGNKEGDKIIFYTLKENCAKDKSELKKKFFSSMICLFK
ncbi:MAG: hypothetical protein N4A57_12490 [Anaeromicrobium sp.]|uniref:hypothetical protein n=1 Tax=Anaeromicrobium sp. TaxID=1929132 RepID=UPI0025D96E3D|nr:hypothetical protein [Anaeromicrobium sp.]MCT4595069.1 hypothetical protein [Anaeromicrobium sp.]